MPGFEARTSIIQTRDLGFERLKQSPSELGLPNPEVFDQSKQRISNTSSSVFGGADRNFAYCRVAHKTGTFCRIASHVDSDLWNLPALGLGNGRRTNDLRHGLLPGLSIS